MGILSHPTLDMGQIVLTFRGGLISKKNRKAPRKGGHGLYLEPKTRLALDRWELQVPGDVRDLKLEHPNIDLYIRYANANIDKDGIQTTVLDVLVKYGVLKNDNIASCNGRMTIHPAERSDDPGVTVVLTPMP